MNRIELLEQRVIYLENLIKTHISNISPNQSNQSNYVKQYDFEQINDPLFSDVKFIGSDEDRVRFTNKMNILLEELSNKNNYIYFNPYSYYTTPDGTLKYEFSDGKVHLGENTFFLERFNDLYTKININTSLNV